jgi:hypothetical protein
MDKIPPHSVLSAFNLFAPHYHKHEVLAPPELISLKEAEDRAFEILRRPSGEAVNRYTIEGQTILSTLCKSGLSQITTLDECTRFGNHPPFSSVAVHGNFLERLWIEKLIELSRSQEDLGGVRHNTMVETHPGLLTFCKFWRDHMIPELQREGD